MTIPKVVSVERTVTGLTPRASYAEDMETAWRSGRKLSPIASNLRIIGFTPLADACAEARNRSRELERPAIELRNIINDVQKIGAELNDPDIPAEEHRHHTELLDRDLRTKTTAYVEAFEKFNRSVVGFMTAAQAQLGPDAAPIAGQPPELNPNIQIG